MAAMPKSSSYGSGKIGGNEQASAATSRLGGSADVLMGSEPGTDKIG
jgi:hypothetical protein